MGSSTYSDCLYSARVSTAKARGTDLFTHTYDIRSGKTKRTVHASLDPAHRNSAGQLIRESFDSAAHPDSVPVAVFFDVTGSMARVPRIAADNLGQLMASLLKKGFLNHPHILFGAIGDATCDEVPLQIGQFEAGNEMDDALTNIYLEGGGGGSKCESYELALYFMARHTDCHAWTRRGKKGYLFLIGDEKPYPEVKRKEVERIMNVSLPENIPLNTVLAEVRERFEVFWIMPGGTTHWDDTEVTEYLRELFGQNFLRLEDPNDIVTLISSTVGVAEGFDLHHVDAALKDVGADAESVARVSKSLVPLASTRAVATAQGALSAAAVNKAERL